MAPLLFSAINPEEHPHLVSPTGLRCHSAESSTRSEPGLKSPSSGWGHLDTLWARISSRFFSAECSILQGAYQERQYQKYVGPCYRILKLNINSLNLILYLIEWSTGWMCTVNRVLLRTWAVAFWFSCNFWSSLKAGPAHHLIQRNIHLIHSVT